MSGDAVADRSGVIPTPRGRRDRWRQVVTVPACRAPSSAPPLVAWEGATAITGSATGDGVSGSNHTQHVVFSLVVSRSGPFLGEKTFP
jgi:hypothetical protein